MFRAGRSVFESGTHIMGIINVTPDSFYAASRAGDDVADRARTMIADGAEIIDLGGQSTRPGGKPASALEELSRVVPAVERLARETDVSISVDTFYPEVAESALRAGAQMINDVSCLSFPGMAEVVAEYGASLCIMHNRRDSRVADLMTDKLTGLSRAANRAIKCGVAPDRIILDGGIGFNKNNSEDWELLERYCELSALGFPLMLGTSRKSMFGGQPEQRLSATLETTAAAARQGILFVRVHDVAENRRVIGALYYDKRHR